MTVTFPREMVTAWSWAEAELTLAHAQELSRTGGGAIYGASLGPSLWRARFRSIPYARNDADQLYGDFLTLRGLTNSFYLVPVRRPWPGFYGDVSGFDLSSLTVAQIRADRGAFKLEGLPVGFKVSIGDYILITTAAGSRELHMASEDRFADAQGEIIGLDVTPSLRAGVADLDAVTLVNPGVEMVLEPDSLTRTQVNPKHYTVSFEAVQRVR